MDARSLSGNLRSLVTRQHLIDFSSNDYLGFSKEEFEHHDNNLHGSTGSRLLNGNSILCEKLERKLAQFHQVEEALIFGSGYLANLGVLSTLPRRGDLILYDSLCHASIREGIKLSSAKSVKFQHNNLDHLATLLQKFKGDERQQVYVVTESVFSMDGDTPDLNKLADLIQSSEHVHLILDEAHSLGVHGDSGEGLCQSLDLAGRPLIRVVTFGKALGAHGSAVLCSNKIKQFLINFCRPFIYTTALPDSVISRIFSAYQALEGGHPALKKLKANITYFNQQVLWAGLRHRFRESETPIQIFDCKGNRHARQLEKMLLSAGYDVRAILSPTVTEGYERLRICLHSFNSKPQMEGLIRLLADSK